eukprot:scaffold4976_cov161-Amphora_coffeaeformis.AAC.8
MHLLRSLRNLKTRRPVSTQHKKYVERPSLEFSLRHLSDAVSWPCPPSSYMGKTEVSESAFHKK